MMKLIKFCIVGGINTLITLLSFYLLNKILNINYLISTVIGYTLGVLNSYNLNKKWTFHDKDTNVLSQFIRFTIINALSLGINLFVMYILVDKLNLDSMISQVVATGFSTISNFIGSKFLVFCYTKEIIN